MAVKDSGEIATNSNYTLGEYSFRIERSSVPGSTNDKIEAICTDKDGKNARKSIQVPSSTKIESWRVDANNDTADVYVTVVSSEVDPGAISLPIPCAGTGHASDGPQGSKDSIYAFLSGDGLLTNYLTGLRSTVHIWASSSPGAVGAIYNEDGSVWSRHPLSSTYTANGKTVYYAVSSGSFKKSIISIAPVCNNGLIVSGSVNNAAVAWLMIYADGAGAKEQLVARFAIDLVDAGGTGPGSDWDDPGDYDPDWEEGDPTHTLYVEVIGALSGRHNDPIVDLSYSYTPSDKDTVKDYGCGGDGGHGGGGGAGASTVVIHKFATNQANSKEVTAIARRHGYGSGGGKGGRGGDGIILIYYGNGDSPTPEPQPTPVIQPISASLSVDKATATVGETITWTLSASGGNGDYQYRFAILDSSNQEVYSTGWQVVSSLSYVLQTAGTYHVIGAVRDSREKDTAQAPQSGTVHVSTPVTEELAASLTVRQTKPKVGHAPVWTLYATGGNGDYQYSFIIYDSSDQQVYSSGWQSSSKCYYSPQAAGIYYAVGTVQDSTGDTAQAPESGTVQVYEGGPELVSWKSGTDAQITAMIQAARQGIIDLSDTWNVGDSRDVRVQAWRTEDEWQRGDTEVMQLVISSFEEYNGCGNVIQCDFGDVTGDAYRLGLELGEEIGEGYAQTRAYTDILPAMANALPDYLKNLMLTFSVQTAVWNNGIPSLTTLSGNKLALRASSEIYGVNHHALLAEGDQVDLYRYVGRRCKAPLYGQTSWRPWWTRSLGSANSSPSDKYYSYVDRYGIENAINGEHAELYFSPFLCL